MIIDQFLNNGDYYAIEYISEIGDSLYITVHNIISRDVQDFKIAKIGDNAIDKIKYKRGLCVYYDSNDFIDDKLSGHGFCCNGIFVKILENDNPLDFKINVIWNNNNINGTMAKFTKRMFKLATVYYNHYACDAHSDVIDDVCASYNRDL